MVLHQLQLSFKMLISCFQSKRKDGKFFLKQSLTPEFEKTILDSIENLRVLSNSWNSRSLNIRESN